ncbi:MAG: hypothetical protein EXR55_02885 [Dehalococcoidia bacterium]|nr:hypothetical protein [Dehalococcoidia bacterium]
MKSLLWGVLLLAGVAAACAAPTPTPIPPTATPAPPEGGALVRVTPSSLAVAPGERGLVSIEVLVAGVGVSAADVTITFDPKSLKVTGVEPGDLLGENTLVGLRSIDQEAGKARIALSRVGKTRVPTPSGALVVVTLQVLKDVVPGARLPLQLAEVTLVDQAFHVIAQVRLQDGEVVVQSP